MLSRASPGFPIPFPKATRTLSDCAEELRWPMRCIPLKSLSSFSTILSSISMTRSFPVRPASSVMLLRDIRSSTLPARAQESSADNSMNNLKSQEMSSPDFFVTPRVLPLCMRILAFRRQARNLFDNQFSSCRRPFTSFRPGGRF